MPIDTDLSDRALHLPADDRAELARRLIVSLESEGVDADAEASWEVEIERRAAAVDRGEVTLVDARDAAGRARLGLHNTDSK